MSSQVFLLPHVTAMSKHLFHLRYFSSDLQASQRRVSQGTEEGHNRLPCQHKGSGSRSLMVPVPAPLYRCSSAAHFPEAQQASLTESGSLRSNKSMNSRVFQDVCTLIVTVLKRTKQVFLGAVIIVGTEIVFGVTHKGSSRSAPNTPSGLVSHLHKRDRIEVTLPPLCKRAIHFICPCNSPQLFCGDHTSRRVHSKCAVILSTRIAPLWLSHHFKTRAGSQPSSSTSSSSLVVVPRHGCCLRSSAQVHHLLPEWPW